MSKKVMFLLVTFISIVLIVLGSGFLVSLLNAHNTIANLAGFGGFLVMAFGIMMGLPKYVLLMINAFEDFGGKNEK